MRPQVYDWIEAYAKNRCDTDRFTSELTALCCCGSPLEGFSHEEEALLDTLCAGAQRFSDDADGLFSERDMLDEAQFRAFFDRLYPELKRRMPYEVQKAFSGGDFDRKEG